MVYELDATLSMSSTPQLLHLTSDKPSHLHGLTFINIASFPWIRITYDIIGPKDARTFFRGSINQIVDTESGRIPYNTITWGILKDSVVFIE